MQVVCPKLCKTAEI